MNFIDLELEEISKVDQIRPKIRFDDEPNALGCSVATPIFVDILDNDPSPVLQLATESFRLPAVSIAAVTGSVEVGSSKVFDLSASIPIEEELTANITLVGIDRFIGGSTSRTMNIAEGGDAAELSVATINDDHSGKYGSFVATFVDEDGSDSSTEVVVTDNVDREAGRALLSGANKAILSDLLGSQSAQTLETAANCVTSAFSGGTGIKLELGGSTTAKNFISEGGEIKNGQKMDSWQEVLGGSFFEFGLFPEEGASNFAIVLRYSNFHDMSADGEGAGKLDSSMFTGHIGFDALIGGDMVAEPATSQSRGELDYGISNDKALSNTSRTTGVHPYLGPETSDGSRLQVIAEYGLDGIELEQEGYATDMLNSNFASFVACGNRVLYSSDSLLFGGTSELILEGESWMIGQFLSSGSEVIGSMRTDERHLQISPVDTHEHQLEDSSTVSPSVSMGLHENGKLGESFLGMEMGGGIGFTRSHGYEISTKGEVLFAGTDQVREWGKSGQLSYDAGSDGLAVQLSVAPECGRSILIAGKALWSGRVLVEDFDSQLHTNCARINAEIGCGLTVWGDLGLLKPYGGVFLSEKQEDKYRVGTKLNFGSGIEFGLESSRTSGMTELMRTNRSLIVESSGNSQVLRYPVGVFSWFNFHRVVFVAWLHLVQMSNLPLF